MPPVRLPLGSLRGPSGPDPRHSFDRPCGREKLTMRWIFTPILWCLAVGAALAIAWRMAGGRPWSLTGRFGPKFIRMVAIVLVMLGAGADEGTGEEDRKKSGP